MGQSLHSDMGRAQVQEQGGQQIQTQRKLLTLLYKHNAICLYSCCSCVSCSAISKCCLGSSGAVSSEIKVVCAARNRNGRNGLCLGSERRLSTSEHLLLRKKIQVHFLTPTKWLTTICYSSLRRSNILLVPPQAYDTHIVYTHMQAKHLYT